MIDNKEKNWQIEIDKKPLDSVGIEEENRSTSGSSYFVFAFLFEVLVVAGQPRFCLVALVGLLLGQSIVGQAMGDAVSTEEEVAVGLLGLSL